MRLKNHLQCTCKFYVLSQGYDYSTLSLKMGHLKRHDNFHSVSFIQLYLGLNTHEMCF